MAKCRLRTPQWCRENIIQRVLCTIQAAIYYVESKSNGFILIISINRVMSSTILNRIERLRVRVGEIGSVTYLLGGLEYLKLQFARRFFAIKSSVVSAKNS